MVAQSTHDSPLLSPIVMLNPFCFPSLLHPLSLSDLPLLQALNLNSCIGLTDKGLLLLLRCSPDTAQALLSLPAAKVSAELLPESNKSVGKTLTELSLNQCESVTDTGYAIASVETSLSNPVCLLVDYSSFILPASNRSKGHHLSRTAPTILIVIVYICVI